MLNKLPEVTQQVNSRGRIRTQVSRLGSEAQNPAPCSFQDARSKGQSFSEELLQELGCRELHRCLVASKTAVASHPQSAGPRVDGSNTHPFSHVRTVPPHGACVDSRGYGLLTAIPGDWHLGCTDGCSYPFLSARAFQPCLSNWVINCFRKEIKFSFSSPQALLSHSQP